MAEQYSRRVLRVAVARIAQHLGWTAIQTTPMELLTDILQRYISETANHAHRYSEQFGRTEPNIDDVGLSFREMGVSLGELNDYVKSIDVLSQPTETPEFPASKSNELNFPKPKSRELLERSEHVDDHLPPMHPDWNDEPMPLMPRTPISGANGFAEDSSTHKSPGLANTSGSEKRPFSSPGEGMPAPKKSRTMSTLPEEAQPSIYEMKSVQMDHSGFLAPTQPGKGKLPDARTPPPPTPTTVIDTNPLHSISNASSNQKPDASSDDDAPIKIVDSSFQEDHFNPSLSIKRTPSPPKIKNASVKSDKTPKLSKSHGLKMKKLPPKIPKSPKGNKSPRPKSPRSPGRSPVRVKSPKVPKIKAFRDDDMLLTPDVIKKSKKKLNKSPIRPIIGKSPSVPGLRKDKFKDDMPSPVRVESPGLIITFDEKKVKSSSEKHSTYDDIIDAVATGPSVRSSPVNSPARNHPRQEYETDSDDTGLLDAVMSSPDINRLKADLERRQFELSQKRRDWLREMDALDDIPEEEAEIPKPEAFHTPAEVVPDPNENFERQERDRRIESTIDDVIANFVQPEEMISDSVSEHARSPSPIPVSKPNDPYAFNEDDMGSPFSPGVSFGSDHLAPKPSLFDFDKPQNKVSSPREKDKKERSKEKLKERKEKSKDKKRSIASSVSDMETFESDVPIVIDNEQVKTSVKVETEVKESAISSDLFDFLDHSPKRSPKKPVSPVAVPITVDIETPKEDPVSQPAIKKFKITRDQGGGAWSSLAISNHEKSSDKEHHKREKKKKKNKDKDKDRDKEKRKDKDKHRDKDKKKDKKDRKEKKEKHKEESSTPTIPKLTFKFGGSGSNPSVSMSAEKEPIKLKIKPFSPPSETRLPPPIEVIEPVVPTPSPASPPAPLPRSPTPEPIRSPLQISKPESPYDLSLSPTKRSLSSHSPSPVVITRSSPYASPSRSLSLPRMSPPRDKSPTPQSPPRGPSPDNQRGVSPFRFASRSPSPPPSRSQPPDLLEPANPPMSATWSPAGGSPRWSPTPIPKFSESPSSSPRRSPPPRSPGSRSPVLMSKSWLNSPVRRSPSSLHPPSEPGSPLPRTPAARSPSPSPPPDSPKLEIDDHSDDGGLTRTVITETVGTTMDENGEVVWICPACKRPDDGSPMIGCDGEHCDDWYHWPCVGITSEPPEEEKWYCPKCKLKVKTKAARKKRPTPKRGGKGKKKLGM